MKQLIQSLALIALFGSVSHLSLSQEVKQVQRAEKNYVDSKKIESKELQTPSASDKTINQSPAENTTPNQVSNNKNVVQTVSVGTRRAEKTPGETTPEIDLVLEKVEINNVSNIENEKQSHVVVKKISALHYRFNHELELDENGRSVYEQRLKGMFPFLENISIKENQCELFFSENSNHEGMKNGIQTITTNIFNFTTYEIQ